MATSATNLPSEPRLFAISGEGSGLFSNPRLLLLPAALGLWLLATLPIVHTLLILWTADPLRSIGMFFPVVSIALIARAWRRLTWQQAGTAWGLLPLLLTVVALWLRETRIVTLTTHHDLGINLLPEGPLLALALSSALLLLGGTRVWRACLFPLFLLLCANPVPSAFNLLLDLPLQHASAATARHFALLIGEHPDGEQLRLMFTPDFGMFIAPGCNGIRGGVTLAYVALIASYWRGFSVPVRLAAGLTGLAMGYLFNFLRLCLLVVYYKVGRFLPAIQPHGALIDYLIGGSLFLFASVCFGLFFFRPTPEPEDSDTLDPTPEPASHAPHRPWLSATLLLAFLALAASNLRAVALDAQAAHLFQPRPAPTLTLPHTVGPYRLAIQWNQRDEYLWGRYTDGLPGHDVLLGLWLSPAYHDAITCHLTRAESITLGQPIAHADGSGTINTYRTFAYNDGLNTVYAASRLCPRCTDLSDPVRWFGPIQTIKRPPTAYFDNASATGVLITHDADSANEASPANFTPIRTFVAALDESALTTRSNN